jgi:uncharacterized protein (DUF427 family)
MAKAPGYTSHPHHRIRETPEERTVRVVVRDVTIAESKNALRVEEDGHPVRYYFPPRDVHTDRLERTDTSTRCPFKGQASYFTLTLGTHRLSDAVWSYEDPYEEHVGLKGRLAFYTEKFPEIDVRIG